MIVGVRIPHSFPTNTWGQTPWNWKAANHYFQDRTLYASNYPSRPHREMIQAYAEWDWAPGVLDRVMGQNALRLMRMA